MKKKYKLETMLQQVFFVTIMAFLANLMKKKTKQEINK
jgi:hypothetical protein